VVPTTWIFSQMPLPHSRTHPKALSMSPGLLLPVLLPPPSKSISRKACQPTGSACKSSTPPRKLQSLKLAPTAVARGKALPGRHITTSRSLQVLALHRLMLKSPAPTAMRSLSRMLQLQRVLSQLPPVTLPDHPQPYLQ
jgi:hypothetical protein